MEARDKSNELLDTRKTQARSKGDENDQVFVMHI